MPGCLMAVFTLQTYGKGPAYSRTVHGEVSKPLVHVLFSSEDTAGPWSYTPACCRGLSGDLAHLGLR